MSEPAIPTRMRILRTDHPPIERTEPLPAEPSLDMLKRLITPLLDGGDLERVAVLNDFDGGHNWQPTDMFVDESGALKHLPKNPEATTIYRRATMLGRTGAPIPRHPDQLPAIFGTAIVFDRRVWF